MLMAAFHHRFGIIPNYEDILEVTYRRLIELGNTVVDVGAHTGRHTTVLAELVGASGSVHAFEPLPFALRSLHGRGLPSHVHIHAVALADRRGTTPFIYAKGAPEESGLRRKDYNQPHLVTTEEITVEVANLDDFASEFSRLDFVKIDAEGGEVACLRGARGLLTRYRPFVTVEYGRPSYSAHGLTKRSLFEEARCSGYRVGDLFGGICQTAADWEAVCDASFWDWFLIPEERAAEWLAKVSVDPDQGEDSRDTRNALLEAELATMRNCKSWRITAPLRHIARILKA